MCNTLAEIKTDLEEIKRRTSQLITTLEEIPDFPVKLPIGTVQELLDFEKWLENSSNQDATVRVVTQDSKM